MAAHEVTERRRVSMHVWQEAPRHVPRTVARSSLIAISGACAGLLTGAIMVVLPPRSAPVAMLLVMCTTLAAGRLASVAAALSHGACAWVSLAGALAGTGYLATRWYGVPAAWILLVLIEDMALLGRLGRRARSCS